MRKRCPNTEQNKLEVCFAKQSNVPEFFWAFGTKLLCQKYIIFGYEHNCEFCNNFENLDTFPKFFLLPWKKGIISFFHHHYPYL